MKQTDKTAISERVKKFIDTVRVGTDCRIALVSPEDVSVVWPSILEYVEEVVSHSQGEATFTGS